MMTSRQASSASTLSSRARSGSWKARIRVGLAGYDRQDQRLLVAEVVVDLRRADARRPLHVLQAGAGHAPLKHQARGHAGDPVPGRLTLGREPGRRPGRRVR